MFDIKKIAKVYDQIGLNFSATRTKLSAEVISLLPKLAENAFVLDLGCGNGVLLTALPSEVSYTGVDFAQTLVDEARRLHPQANFFTSDILDQAIWDDLPQFDLIAALAVFHHLPSPNDHIKLLQNIKQHLKANGTCLISVWRLNQPKFDRFRSNQKHLAIPFHSGPSRDFYAFTDDELTNLARKAGFSDIKTKIAKDNLYLVLQS